jgi:hypothetical protein
VTEREFDPVRENAAYKWFIEQLFDQANASVAVNRIRKNGHPVRTNDADLPLEQPDAETKALFLKLDNKERELLAQLLRHERIGAVHDVASFLEGYLSNEELKISFHEHEIPASPYWSMHHDLIGLVRGEGWEDEQ